MFFFERTLFTTAKTRKQKSNSHISYRTTAFILSVHFLPPCPYSVRGRTNHPNAQSKSITQRKDDERTNEKTVKRSTASPSASLVWKRKPLKKNYISFIFWSNSGRWTWRRIISRGHQVSNGFLAFFLLLFGAGLFPKRTKSLLANRCFNFGSWPWAKDRETFLFWKQIRALLCVVCNQKMAWADGLVHNLKRNTFEESTSGNSNPFQIFVLKTHRS